MTTPVGQGDSELQKLIRTRFMTIRLIHLALVVGSGLFGAVVFELGHKQMTMQLGSNPIVLVAAMMSLGSMAASLVLRKVMQQNGSMPTDPNGVFARYQVICLVQWAMIEGGALFAAVATLLTKSGLAFVFFVASWAFLASRRPSAQELLAMSNRR